MAPLNNAQDELHKEKLCTNMKENDLQNLGSSEIIVSILEAASLVHNQIIYR